MRCLAALLLVFSLCVVPTTVNAGGKRKNASSITFHLETQPEDNPKMIFSEFVSGRQRFFRKVPDVLLKDVQAYNPFPSQDGDGFGLLLKLKPGPSNRYSAISTANIGHWVLARVNGRSVDAFLIDKSINDGEIVIWKGVAPAEITELDKILPRIGESKPRG